MICDQCEGNGAGWCIVRLLLLIHEIYHKCKIVYFALVIDLQRYTRKTKDWATQTTLDTGGGGELRCSGMVSSSCYTCSSCHLILRAGTAYPSRAHEFTMVFSGVHNARCLVLCVCFVDHCLSFSPFVFWPLYYLSLFY